MSEEQREDEVKEASPSLPDAQEAETSAAPADAGLELKSDPPPVNAPDQDPVQDPAENPDAQPAKPSVEGPRKILEALEGPPETEAAPKDAEPAPVSAPVEEPAVEESPAVPAEGEDQKDDEVLSIDAAAPSEEPPVESSHAEAVLPDDCRVDDPESLISDAMKKLDRLLETIRSDSVISSAAEDDNAASL